MNLKQVRDNLQKSGKKLLRKVKDMTDPGHVDYEFDDIYFYEGEFGESKVLAWATDDNQLILCMDSGISPDDFAFIWKEAGKDQIDYRSHKELLSVYMEDEDWIDSAYDFYDMTKEEFKADLKKAFDNFDSWVLKKAKSVANDHGYFVSKA